MSLPERLSENLYKEGLVSEEDREIVEFGLESLGGNLAGVFLTLLVGFLFGEPNQAIFFYLLLFPLRKSIGGFHANTKTGCLITSAMTLVITFTIFLTVQHPPVFYLISFFIFGCLIFALSPVDNISKPFDDTERRVYRRRGRIVLFVESTLFFAAYYFSCDSGIRCLCMVYFVSCVALIMGLLKKKFVGLAHNKDQKK